MVPVGCTSGTLSWVLGHWGGKSATERVFDVEKVSTTCHSAGEWRKGGPLRPARSQGSREHEQTVDLLEEWLHGAGSSSGTEPLPCLGGFGSAVFQTWVVRGIANCRLEV